MFGAKKREINLESLMRENDSLRRQVSDTQKLSKKQLEVESKKLRLANRQLSDYNRERLKQNRQAVIQSGRRFLERIAAKPISKKRAGEMLFGTRELRDMTGNTSKDKII